jgi:hypothetical protein
MGSQSVMLDLPSHPVWATLTQAPSFAKREAWEQHRVTLAHAIPNDAYMNLAVAYNGLANVAAAGSHKEPSEQVADSEGWAVGKTFQAVNRGFLALSLLLHTPPAWRWRARRKFEREQREEVERSLNADPSYRAFIARYGSNPQ